MMKTRLGSLLIAVSLLVLVGCSTTLSNEQVEAMHTPTLTLDCTTGCSASYTDPRDRPKMPTNGWDVGVTAINAASGVITSTAPWAAIGITATKGITNAVGDNNSDNSVRNDNSVRTDDNSSRVDNRTDDNSWRQTNDSTHEPTIVRPEVVNTPEPTIVQPNATSDE